MYRYRKMRDDWELRLAILLAMSFLAGSIIGWVLGWYI